MRFNKAAQDAETVVGHISQAMGILAIIVLVAMMILTVSDVLLRSTINYTITATPELTEYMMVFVAFLGLAWCAFKGMHIKAELIVSKFSPRGQGIIDIINSVIVLGVCVLLASQSFQESKAVRQLHLVSEITDIPRYPFYWVVTFGFTLLFLIMIILLVKSINKAVKG